MDERLIEMVRDALVVAGELAYVEGAFGASALIEQFGSLFRYLTHADDAVSVADEIAALRSYAFVQRTRHTISVEPCDGPGFVARKSVLRFVDECCRKEWEDGHLNALFTVRFARDTDGWKVLVDIRRADASRQVREMRLEQID